MAGSTFGGHADRKPTTAAIASNACRLCRVRKTKTPDASANPRKNGHHDELVVVAQYAKQLMEQRSTITAGL